MITVNYKRSKQTEPALNSTRTRKKRQANAYIDVILIELSIPTFCLYQNILQKPAGGWEKKAPGIHGIRGFHVFLPPA
jgi:hypothetical protein